MRFKPGVDQQLKVPNRQRFRIAVMGSSKGSPKDKQKGSSGASKGSAEVREGDWSNLAESRC